MTKVVVAFVCSLSIISCAGTPAPGSRFPDFAEKAKRISSIDVVLDLVIGSDIQGPVPGINLEQHRLIAKSARAEIKEILEDKGYAINSFHVNGGLFIDWDKASDSAADSADAPETSIPADDSGEPNTDGRGAKYADLDAAEAGKETPIYVFTTNNQSSGEAVTGPFLDPSAEPWTHSEVTRFLIGLQQQSDNFYNHKTAQGKPAPSLVLEQVPDSLAGLNSDALMIVRISAAEVSAGRSVGVSILTGLASAIISGGTFVSVTTPLDGHFSEVMIVDTDDREILWYNILAHQGNNLSNYAIAKLLKPLNQPVLIGTRTNATNTGQATSDLPDISGTYVSAITSSHYWRFNTEEQRTMRLEISQQGDQVIATNEVFDLKIVGTREGDNISFYALPNKMTHFEITGEWQLVPNTSRLTGSWDLSHSQHPANGEWNLRKIQ